MAYGKDGLKGPDSPLTTTLTTTSIHNGMVAENVDHLHRRLGNRQIQLMAIGGAIGTALFVSIGSGLAKGGPLSLFLTFTLYSCLLGLVNNCMAEMATQHPVAGGFVRMAGKWVDDAFGFMAGWNFFFFVVLAIPFEITAINVVLHYWTNAIPTWAVCVVMNVLYGGLNILAVKVYGEAEFWMSTGKVLLVFTVFFFTLITMCGGNPQYDAYGFRYWNNPGPVAEYRTTGPLGRFEAILAALWNASFTIVGPEYIATIAAEAKRPRIYIKNAFKMVYWRFGFFFILGALCVAIVVPYNDPDLVKYYISGEAGGTAAASPYVIAMGNLGVTVLPHIVNALLLTSIFSAGNTYVYVATRNLYGIALAGRAPRFLKHCTKQGVPIWALGVVMCFSCLSFLQVSQGSSTVLTWLVNIITAGGLIDYVVMCITYLCFYRACKVQGFDRARLPYRGWFQPYSAWIGLVGELVILLFFGYTSFAPWDVSSFFTYYTLVLVDPVLYVGWKLLKRTKIVPSTEVDLTWETPAIDAYEASFTSPPLGFWTEILHMFTRSGGKDRRDSVDATQHVVF